MISITTKYKQFELRLRLSLADPMAWVSTNKERTWRALDWLFSFSQIRKIEKQKQEMMHQASFNHWWV